MEKSTMIPVEEALKIVLEHTPALGTETVDLMGALGRTLAEDVQSDMNMPPFDKSAMDGYAVVAADTERASGARPVVLEVLEEIPAGKMPTQRISSGRASRIMTGAPLPDGADSVIMVEFTAREGDDRVQLFEPVEKGKNVCYLGEDIQLGQVVLKAGALIRPQEVGVLASVGVSKVSVIRQPEVSIITTGSEIVEPNFTPKPSQIRNSNGYSMSAQAMEAGARVRYLGISDDTTPELKEKVLEGLQSDILMLSGGVSVGDYDLVEDTLQACGVETLFGLVRMKPGKPTTFGVRGTTLVFGLAGNPVSTMVGFELFVRPAIRKMQRSKETGRPVVDALLDHDFRKRPGRRQFAPARTVFSEGGWRTAIVESHGSADLLAMTEADSLAIIPEEYGRLNAGDMVKVLLLG